MTHHSKTLERSKTCKMCGTAFIGYNTSKYCSPACSKEARRHKRKEYDALRYQRKKWEGLAEPVTLQEKIASVQDDLGIEQQPIDVYSEYFYGDYYITDYELMYDLAKELENETDKDTDT